MKERMRRIISDKQVKLDDNDSDESPAMNDGLKLSPKSPPNRPVFARRSS
jgi:hypothetical protein